MNFYFGTHIRNDYDIFNSISKVKKLGGNIIQLFPPNSFTFSDTDLLKKFLKKNNMKCVVHSNYYHNIARKLHPTYDIYFKQLESETRYAEAIGAIGIVIHLGKQLDLKLSQAYNNMFIRLLFLHNNTKKFKSKIIIETSTGQGTELCYKLKDLAYFYNKISSSRNLTFKNRIKLCIDTCHIFSSGEDIRTKKGVDDYLKRFDDLIGLNHVCLIHINDCKVILGGKNDWHENIGEGYIGLKGLKYFFNIFKKKNIPTILETPSDKFDIEFKLLNN